MRKTVIVFSLLVALLIYAGVAQAQSLSFSLVKETVNVFWNEDGTESIDYVFTFQNSPTGSVIDYVDVGIPNPNFDESSISADVDGNPVTDISKSGFQGQGGSGVAVGLGSYSIQPGASGNVHVYIGKVSQVLELDSQDQNYASAVFSPSWFGSQYVLGSTDMTVTFHLPPGVKSDEPRWHQAPDGFPSTPETALDDNNRIIYTWHNPTANAYTKYDFGASFPKSYVPSSAFARSNPFGFLGSINFANCLVPLGCIGFFALIIGASLAGDRKRKMQYLPPRIAIEGHGIKRGLTSIEAGILMEEPMDKILTMILFSLIKKNAAQVTSRDPLEIKPIDPAPEGLYPYEKDFLQAFQKTGKDRQKDLQATMVSLIKEVTEKMKGFSRKETVAYYKDIMQRAWSQVEAAQTPD
ncbi:MAG: hypothetical protein ACM3PY_14175, partial [Omnitrophica WOR_2 bacterium]